MARIAARGGRQKRWGAGAVGARVGFGRWALVLGIGPAVVLFLIFLGFPILESIHLSFSQWGGVGAATGVGLQNYSNLIRSGALWHTLLLTAQFAGITAAGIMVTATLLAAAMNAKVWGATAYRFVWFLPVIAPAPAAGVFWSLAWQPGGAANALLGALGLGNQHALLAQNSTALYPPILAGVWAGTGLAFLLVLGSMRTIPTDVYEAAKIDGASATRQFFTITLPLIRPVLVTTTMLEVIWNANGFTLLWAMTQGGPGFSTSVLAVYVYREAFTFSEFGLANAAAVLGGAALVVFGLVMLRASKSQREVAA